MIAVFGLCLLLRHFRAAVFFHLGLQFCVLFLQLLTTFHLVCLRICFLFFLLAEQPLPFLLFLPVDMVLHLLVLRWLLLLLLQINIRQRTLFA